MKKIYLLLYILPAFVLAQSTNQNWIKSTTYKVPTINGITATDGSGAVTDEKKVVNVTYFDGLGRPIQKVAHKQSATGNNIVTPITYDANGRHLIDYLPFPTQSTSLDFTPNSTIISDPTGYYINNYGTDDGQYPYSVKRQELSPRARVLEQGAPGMDWVVQQNTDSDHTIKFDYGFNKNTPSERVKRYTATATWSASLKLYEITLGNASGTVYYPENTLVVTIVKDENWIPNTSTPKLNTTEEYKNKEGQVVLKRSFNGNNQTPHDTYYVYDQFGNLTYVIPPMATGTIGTAQLAGWCYQYKYDDRNRLVQKQLPGKQPEFILYDRLDRIVGTGPALNPYGLGTNGWMFTKYDIHNRAVLTGWMQATVTAATRATLQTTLNGATALQESKTTTNTSVSSVSFPYTNVAWPTGTAYTVLTLNYYDNYNFPNAPSSFTTVEGQTVSYNNSTNKPHGLATGSWVRVLTSPSTTDNENSYTLYDHKARSIRSHKNNHTGGFLQVDNVMDFEGKILKTVTRHRLNTSSTTILLTDNFTFDFNGRLEKHTQQSNFNTHEEILSLNQYNELGQLINKKVGSNLANSHLQKVDYRYSIRGWLKGINDVNTFLNGSEPEDLFAFKISYNEVDDSLNGDIKALYNGNISETSWRSASDGVLRRYGFMYDHLNRLSDAIYQKPETTGADNSYNESIRYDMNGNIQELLRNGYLDGDGSAVLPIDNLAYVYKENQLMSVQDYTMSLDGFKDGNQQGNDYDYDENGNMQMDLNKGIQQITYNHLNLPVFMDFGLNKNITYLYNALGVKLSKIVTAAGKSTITQYSNGFQYQDGKLQHFPTTEGYVSVVEGRINYVYNYTDHLGNIRLSYGLDPEEQGQLKILSENHYYPYGLKHSNYNAIEYAYKENELGTYVVLDPTQRSDYRYKYNGMEFQDELGLNLYDMDFRDYDPAIARWTGIDPVTHHNMSPYMAFDGNPVFWADPSGADAIISPNGITFDGEDALSAFNGLLNFLDGEDSSFNITGMVVDLSDLQSDGGSDGGNYISLIVGSNGIVYDRFGSGSTYKIFDRKGEQLKLNDYTNDAQWLGSMGVGDRLYNNIDGNMMIKFLMKAGGVSAWDRGLAFGYAKVAKKSHLGFADFGANQIINQFGIDYRKTEYNGFGDGSFYRFANQKSLYNLADAGNFMWGAWMAANGFFYSETKYGAHLNSLVTFNGYDSTADQRAIRNGYYFVYNLMKN